eukprot:3940841-Rhodomonas_salina.3
MNADWPDAMMLESADRHGGLHGVEDEPCTAKGARLDPYPYCKCFLAQPAGRRECVDSDRLALNELAGRCAAHAQHLNFPSL